MKTSQHSQNMEIGRLQKENGKLRRQVFTLERQIKNMNKAYEDIIKKAFPTKYLSITIEGKIPHSETESYFKKMAKERRVYSSKL